jgi:hypothetical protein
MFQQSHQTNKGLSLIDYGLIGLAGFAGFVALNNFSLNLQTITWASLAVLAAWYAFDGKKATGKDLVIIIILLSCGLIALKNLEPYEALVRIIFGEDSPPAKLLNFIPVVGRIWAYVIALIVFLPIQILEIYVSIIEGNRQSLKTTISKLKLDQASNTEPDPDLDRRIVALERKYNNFVIDTLMRFYQYRNWAYIIDAAIVFWYYCPVKGGWEEFQWGFPTVDQWHFPNVLLCVIIMFLFQKLVELYLWLRNVDEYFVRGNQP